MRYEFAFYIIFHQSMTTTGQQKPRITIQNNIKRLLESYIVRIQYKCESHQKYKTLHMFPIQKIYSVCSAFFNSNIYFFAKHKT
jgi:hypothetical protein